MSRHSMEPVERSDVKIWETKRLKVKHPKMQNERSEWVTSRLVAFIIKSILSSLGENQDIAHHFRC